MSHFLARSQSCIEHLLASTSTSLINSTLTIRGTNYITIYNQELSSNLKFYHNFTFIHQELEALKSFIKSIGKHRTYIDTAFDLDGNNQQKSNSKVVKKESKSFTMVIVLVTLFGVGILAAIGFWYYKKKHSKSLPKIKENLPPAIPNVYYIPGFGQIPQHMVPNDHCHQ